MKKTEQTIKDLSAKQKQLEHELADTSLYEKQNKELLQQKLRDKQAVDTELEDTEYLWLEISEGIELLQGS